MDSHGIRVQPCGTNTISSLISNEKDVVFQLSDLDHLMPKIYVHLVEIFRLPADTNKAFVLDILTNSLSRALADHPILTGTVHLDNEAKRIVVKKRPDSSVGLFVKGQASQSPTEDDTNTSLPSFTQMEQEDFPGHWLKADKVLPAPFQDLVANPADDLATDGPEVCAIQVTFIEGGLILGLAIHHHLCDGNGLEAFLDNWSRHAMAESKRLVSNEAALATITPPMTTHADFGREAVLTTGNKTTQPKEQEAWRALENKFPMYTVHPRPPSPPPADFKMPIITSRIWHFPRSKLQKLKDLCSSSSSDSTKNCHISSYDVILALIWRVFLRAKQPLLQADPTTPTRVVYPVNARGRSSPAVPEGYIGSGVCMRQPSQPFTISDVLQGTLEELSGSNSAVATLALLARTVRALTNSVTPEYISDVVSFVGNAPDRRWIEFNIEWVLGLDCLSTSWHNMKSYETHDFGFGTPAALRFPDPKFEGFVFVYPTRRDKKDSIDEGLEVSLILEESCYERLEQDRELALFAERRGLD